jgi:hypothetical protein
MGLTFPLVPFHSYAGMQQRNSCTVTCVEGAGHVVGDEGGVAGWWRCAEVWRWDTPFVKVEKHSGFRVKWQTSSVGRHLSWVGARPATTLHIGRGWCPRQPAEPIWYLQILFVWAFVCTLATYFFFSKFLHKIVDQNSPILLPWGWTALRNSEC